MSTTAQRVTIERIVQGGRGLARLEDGRVVMIPGVLPGEVVDVKLTDTRESYARGTVTEVVEPSGDRMEPDCRYAPKCGGCQFWHTDLQTQFDLKVQAAVETFERVADLSPSDIERYPSSADRRYRTRVTFHRRKSERDLAETESRTPFEIGFFEESSNTLVPVRDCLVAVERVNQAREAIESGLEDVGEADVLIETADDASCVISVRVSSDEQRWEPPESFGAWGAALDEVAAVRGVRVLTDEREWVLGDPTVDADQCLADSPLESMRVPAGLFRQANPEINKKLVNWVSRQLRQRDCSTVLELFCGTGNISFSLRDDVHRLVGLEVAEQAVQTANTIAKFKQLDGFEFRRRDLSGGTGESVEQSDGPFDAAVLDPPRGGAAGVTDELATNEWMAREAMVYVSCDPPALARDLGELTSGPWRVCEVAAFDMFPMTSHLEVAAVLERRQIDT